MEELFDVKAAKEYIAEKFREQGDFSIIEPKLFDQMLDRVMALDEEYMENSGVEDGGVYDDDAAYDYMHEKLMAEFPEHKMYMMRLVDDYMAVSYTHLTLPTICSV